jgi:hypothetical protein
MFSPRTPSNVPRLRCALYALGLLLATARAGAAGSYNWIGVTGSAATPTNWSPVGVPGASDLAQFTTASTYTTTWPATVDTVDRIYVTAGSPTFSIASRLRLNSVVSIGNGALTLLHGSLTVNHWSCVGSGALNLIYSGVEGDATGIGTSTFSGTSGGPPFTLNIDLDCAFRSNGSISLGSSGPFVGLVSGSGPPATLETTASGPFDQGTITVGEYGGPAQLTLDNGAVFHAAGDLYVGRHPAGSGVFRPQATLGASTVLVQGQTFIGSNGTAGEAGGQGSMVLDGDANLPGRCWLGDADDPAGAPVKSALQIEGPAQAVFASGITMSDALSAELRLMGGTTQLIGGTSSIHQAAPFSVDGYGLPVLWLEGGSVTDIQNGTSGGPALGIGRTKTGTVRVAGPGTVLNVHGATAMADSAYGYAALDVDSSATLHLMGDVTEGEGGPANIAVSGPSTTATVSGTLSLLSSASTVRVDSLAALSLNGGVFTGPSSYGFVDALHGAQVSIQGVTLTGLGALRAREDGAQISATGHCDLTGRSRVESDSGGVFIYNDPTKTMTVGPGCFVEVFRGGFAQVSPQLDLRGVLAMSEVVTSDLVVNRLPTSRVRPTPGLGQLNAAGAPDHSTLQSPLVRVLDAGQVVGTGTIAGRVHLDSRIARISVPNPYSAIPGRLTVGDSTATDGFVSIGQTDIGEDTLRVLDADGPDLGRISIDGGWLSMRGSGHLRSGDWLSGHGRIEGSLDVQSGGRLDFAGTIKGSVQLAGELGHAVAPGILAITGGLQEAPSAQITLRIGDGPQDLITVGGQATLAGTLDVRIGAGILPVPGDTLTLLSAASITGTFAGVTFDGGPSSGVIQVIYGPAGVRIAVVGQVTGVDDGLPSSTGVSRLELSSIGGLRNAELRLDLPRDAHARVVLYDVGGRQLAELVNADLAAGRHRIAVGREWTPASGVYFARAGVQTADGTRTLSVRLVVLR